MGWSSFFDIFKSKSDIDALTDIDNFEDFINSISNTEYYINCNNVDGQIDAYKKSEIVQSVISRRAESIGNLRIWAVDDNGNEVVSQAAKNVIEKLKQPNPYQGFRSFFTQFDTYRALFGKVYIRKVKSSIFNTEYYYIIPNNFISEDYKNKYDATYDNVIDKYRILGKNGVEETVQPSEIHVFYDGILDFDGYRTNGMSKLRSLSEVVSTAVVLWEVRTELIGDSGARNIISMGARDVDMITAPFLNKERKSLDEGLKKYGSRRKQIKNLVINTDAKVHALTSKITDMDLSQTLKDSVKSICNAYSCPPMLIGVEDSRFKTLPEARKEFYTQAIIPSLNYIFEEFMNMMGITDNSFHIDADYSHLDFYQEAKKEEAVAFQQMAGAVVPLVDKNIISVEEARRKLNITDYLGKS